MDKLTYEQLIEKATNIILQEGHVKEDVKTLSQIKFLLATQHKNFNTLGASQETLYNNERSNKTVELQNTGMAVGKAENEAKAQAENSHGEWRINQAEAQNINKIMGAIDSFMISLNIEFKNLDTVQV